MGEGEEMGSSQDHDPSTTSALPQSETEGRDEAHVTDEMVERASIALFALWDSLTYEDAADNWARGFGYGADKDPVRQEAKFVLEAALPSPPPAKGEAVAAQEGETRDTRQAVVAEWCAAAFGIDHAASVAQRGLRHAEEAIEAAQAAEVDPAQLHKLVDYIYAKPPGDLRQELGGSGLTLLALANAAGIGADEAEAAEVARVLSKPLAFFHARNEVKNAAGFDALAYPSGHNPQEPAKPSGGQQDLERNLSMTDVELIEQALSHPPLSQPPRAGREKRTERRSRGLSIRTPAHF